MIGALTGFATIAIVIAAGALVAHLGLFDLKAQVVLSRLAFFVATPCLMLLTIGESDLHRLLSANLAASAGSVVVAGALWLVIARWRWKVDSGEAVIGALCSTYVNAGNLGVPIAAYVLGDASLVAPTILTQLLVMAPVSLSILDRRARGGGGLGRTILGALTNPLTVASLLGLVLGLTDTTLPTVIRAPIDLIGQMAVPAMLFAYGIALRLGPGLGVGLRGRLWVTCTLKLLVQPLVAYAIAHWLLGLTGGPLLAIVIIAALPTAQNVFIYATCYDTATSLARDTGLITTIGSVPVILAATLLLA